MVAAKTAKLRANSNLSAGMGGKCEFAALRRETARTVKADLRNLYFWFVLFRNTSSGKRTFAASAQIRLSRGIFGHSECGVRRFLVLARSL